MIERQTGCDVPHRLLGVTVSGLCAGVHIAAIEQELVSRNMHSQSQNIDGG
jgi:hypothetical protein